MQQAVDDEDYWPPTQTDYAALDIPELNSPVKEEDREDEVCLCLLSIGPMFKY